MARQTVKRIWGDVIFEIDAPDLRRAVEEAVRQKISLAGADINGVLLHDADLRNADLRGAVIYNTSLHDADLRGADLTGASLRRSGLDRVDLTGAVLTRADLSGSALYGANLSDANLDGVVLHDTDIEGVVLGDGSTVVAKGAVVQMGAGRSAFGRPAHLAFWTDHGVRVVLGDQVGDMKWAIDTMGRDDAELFFNLVQDRFKHQIEQEQERPIAPGF